MIPYYLSSQFFIAKTLHRKCLEKYVVYIRGKVLDIGCGTKPYMGLLSCEKYISLDKSAEVNPDFVGSVTDMPFADGYFNGVICTEVLEHIPDPVEALREIYRVMAAGGHLYLTVPQSWCLHYEPDDFFRFTKYGIRLLLEKNGFKVVETERIGGIFSVVSQRMIDVAWQSIANLMKTIAGPKTAERVATMSCLPFSIFGYLLARAGDGMDKRDALSWAVLAKK